MRLDDLVRNTFSRYIPERKIETKTADTSNVNYTSTLNSKVFEKNFSAGLTAAKLNLFTRNPKNPPADPPLTSSGSGTATAYRTGNPARPNIHHDNGFLQNPNDRNDPKPIPTVAPSQADKDYYNDQLRQVRLAQIADDLPVPFTDKDNEARRLDDGIEAYRHFLEGKGADRNFSYEKFINEDSAGKTILNNAIADTQRGAEDLYNQMIARDPSLAGKPVTFNITSGVITVGASSQYPYPKTEDWQKAIGGHAIWNSATITVKPPSQPGGKPQFSMQYTLHGEDRYNFNPGQYDIKTGVPDATRGKLEQTGLAHQYTQYGTAQRSVAWTQGDISTTTSVKNQGR